MPPRLTPKREKYCQEYVNGDDGVAGNKTESYLIAYPKSQQWKRTSVSVKACQLSKTWVVEERIKELQEEKAHRIREMYAIKEKKLLEIEACIIYSDIRDLFTKDGILITNPHKLEPKIARAIAAIDVINDPQRGKIVRFKLHDKGKALERMERHLGMFEKDGARDWDNPLAELLRTINGATRGLPNRAKPAIRDPERQMAEA